MHRRLEAPSSIDDEEVLMYDQASYDVGTSFSSSWKLGLLYLTPKHLFFIQGKRKILTLGIDRLKEVKVVERAWILGKIIEQLRLSLETDRGLKVFYIGVKDPLKWKEALKKNG